MRIRAAVLEEFGKPLVVQEVELAGPKAGEVLVRLKACGVCHTDLYTASGADPSGYAPCVLGHEGAGVVEAIGEGVTSVAPGDHVVTLFSPQCGECIHCRSPMTNLCLRDGQEDDVHVRVLGGRSRERRVLGHERLAELLRERDEHRVSRRQVVPELPAAVPERQPWKQLDRKVAEVGDRAFSSALVEAVPQRVTPQHGDHLECEKVRRGKLCLSLHHREDVRRDTRAEQEVDDHGGVDDGHSPCSRRALTVASLGSRSCAAPRAWIRAASSAGVGRSAVRPSTPRTYSERPALRVARPTPPPLTGLASGSRGA
jgi:hypothetical protein